jgi:hypothetical protein
MINYNLRSIPSQEYVNKSASNLYSIISSILVLVKLCLRVRKQNFYKRQFRNPNSSNLITLKTKLKQSTTTVTTSLKQEL